MSASESLSSEGDFDDEDYEGSFRGYASTWRSFTVRERSLALSQWQQQANDLSVHLYNSHTLQRPGATPRTVDDEGGVSSWTPDSIWTRWPLQNNAVPREDERFGAPVLLDDDAYRSRDQATWSRGTELQDELHAVILRLAKVATRTVQPARCRERRNSNGLTSGAVSGDVRDNHEAEPHVRPAKRQKRVPSLELLSDDEEAAVLTQPIVTRIMARLDSLLSGIHRAKLVKHPRRRGGPTRDRASSTVAENAAGPETEQTRRLVSHGPSGEDVQPPGAGQYVTDWSDLLQFAAATGWDAEVIKSAYARCLSLFGEPLGRGRLTRDSDTSEALQFFCPIEDCKRHAIAFELPFRWREHLKRSHGFDRDQIAMAERELEQDIPPGRLLSRQSMDMPLNCPIPDCRRHDIPYEQPPRWREHLKRSHNFDTARIAELEREMNADDGND